MKKCIAIVTAFFIYTGLTAHHAMDYIEMDSYSTPKQGEFLFHFHYDYMVDSYLDPSSDHWEITPGFSAGLHNRLMLDVHAHFAKFSVNNLNETVRAQYPAGPSPFVEAIAASLQFKVTKEKQLPIDIAIGINIEVPFPDAVNLLGSEFGYGAQIILSWDWGLHNNITLNLNYGGEGLYNHSFSWAVGFKFVLSLEDANAPCAGIEVLGDFTGAVAIMPGLYISINDTTTIKTGLLIGLHNYDNALRYNITLMKRW